MRKPKYPGQLIEKMQAKMKLAPAKHKRKKTHHLVSPLTGLKEGSPEDVKMDKNIAAHMKSKEEKSEMHKGKHKLPHMKPKGAKGKAMVKKLGRTFKTGGFAKIASKAAKKYGSEEKGKKVAGAVFWKMAKARGKHKVMCKTKHKHTAKCK